MDELMTVPEMQHRLRVGRTVAWNLVLRNQVPSVRIGKRRLVRTADVQAFVMNHLEGGNESAATGSTPAAARGGRRVSARHPQQV